MTRIVGAPVGVLLVFVVTAAHVNAQALSLQGKAGICHSGNNYCNGPPAGGGAGFGSMNSMGNSMVMQGMQAGFNVIGQGIAAMIFGDPAAEARAAEQRRQAERARQAAAAAEAKRRRLEYERKVKEYSAEKQALQDELNRKLAMLGGGPGPGVVDLSGMTLDQANQNLMAAQARMFRERLDQEREMHWVDIDGGVPELSPEARARAEVSAAEGKPLLTRGDLLEVTQEAFVEVLQSRLGSAAAKSVGGVVVKAGEFGIKWIDEGRAWMDERNAGLDDALKVQRSAGQRIRQLEKRLEQLPPGSQEHTRMGYELASQRAALRDAERTLIRAGAMAPEDAVKASLFNLSSFTKAGVKTLGVPGPLKDSAKFGFDRLAKHRLARKYLAQVPGLGAGVGKAVEGVAGKLDGSVLDWDRRTTNRAVDGVLEPPAPVFFAR